ncbi:MAG: S-layer homology domain-containing protein [Candidatus Peregrinibacteria bacterium]|nr:S-layer homology domain-containing protein [Candidatus Peregrinibacteria bacterium]
MKKIHLLPVLFFALSLNANAATFPDVPADNKNFQAIEFLADKNIIKGYADGTFGPGKLVNRAEAVKIITSALNIKTDGSYVFVFPDVKKEAWFFPYVMGGKAAGIIGGYKDGTFKPTDPVNLAETMKILATAAKVQLPATVPDNVFTDVKKEAWYASHIQYGRDHNIILSDDYGAVHPDQSMTRAAFAELVFRMMTVQNNKGEPFPLEINWNTYNGDNLPFQIKFDDKNWKVVKDNNQVVFIKPDKQYSQFSATRVYPNSAVVTVTLDANAGNMVTDQYFTNIKNAFPGAAYKKFKLKDLDAYEVVYQNSRMVDWYVYLKNKKVLAIYTEFGNGALGFQLQQAIKAMLGTLVYKELPATNAEDYTDVLSNIMKMILIKNKGMDTLNSLPEKTIILTDALGAGNGPVDYYYSTKANYTFKYERTDDVILDSRSGKTTSF